jgi:regulator of sirC expression with transglutaminase-like and TPR domain
MQREDEEIELAEAALLMAQTEYPDLDISIQLERLEGLAARFQPPEDRQPSSNISALNELLFDKEKFTGNDEEYDDPRNSYLNDVLDRRKGIPITLSLVYTEVARRHNLPLQGVGFPGHFLVKYSTGTSEIIIDPYHQGTILSTEDCEERLKQHFGAEARLKPEFFAVSTRKQTLTRMLNNLKGSYFRRHNFPKVLTMIELSLAIDPGSSQDVRDRGMVYFAMKRYGPAMVDLQAYLKISRREDPHVPEVLEAIHRIRALMN